MQTVNTSGINEARQLKANHVNHQWIYVVCYSIGLGGDIIEHLAESLRLELLALNLSTNVTKVEEDAALLNLFEKQVMALVKGSC